MEQFPPTCESVS